METINILPGLYQDALEKFLKQNGMTVTRSEDALVIPGDEAKAAALLGEFLQNRCLLEEAKRVLRPECGLPCCPNASLREEAALRAVSCTHKEAEQALLEYFTESHTLHLEGFLRFRMRAAVCEVRYLARLCAEELMQEEKYREFLMLLQSYVQDCVPLIDTVLLLADTAGSHHLFTENGVEITYDYADLEDAESLENEDDVILSSLLTIAPRTVYLYGKDRSANPCLVDTIRKIFSVQEIC